MTPDRSRLRAVALQAAASVVLALGTPACRTPPQSVKDVVADPDTDPGTEDDTPDTEVPADSADSDSDAPPVSEDPPKDELGPAPDCREVPMSEFECCESLRAWCLATHGEDTDAVNECHFGPNYDGSTGCIPWGPPVPPELGALRAAVS